MLQVQVRVDTVSPLSKRSCRSDCGFDTVPDVRRDRGCNDARKATNRQRLVARNARSIGDTADVEDDVFEQAVLDRPKKMRGGLS